jgi:hypothetical protein
MFSMMTQSSAIRLCSYSNCFDRSRGCYQQELNWMASQIKANSLMHKNPEELTFKLGCIDVIQVPVRSACHFYAFDKRIKT